MVLDRASGEARSGQRGGQHRRRAARSLTSLVALAVALAGVGALLLRSQPERPPVAATELPLAQAWPGTSPVDLPGSLPDGPAYSPQFFLDARTSVGTAPSPDGAQLRLVVRAPDGVVRVLRSLPMTSTPQFGGFTLAGDDLAWAESTTDAQGRGQTRMWTVHWRSGAAPRALTADAGQAAFFNSQYDMVIEGGRLYWVAVAPGEETATEVRSVPLTGGRVTVRRLPGAWALSAWPWLVSAGTGQIGPVKLRELDANREIEVPADGTELVTCSPRWCRVLVLSSGGAPARTDLMRPDGSARQRMAGSAATASLIDVAVLDRYEVFSRAGAQSADASAISSQELLLYDERRKRSVVVAGGVGLILCRGGILWWSTGEDDKLVWHALDLRALP